MPMIHSKITVGVSDETREVLVAELGKAIAVLGKPERHNGDDSTGVLQGELYAPGNQLTSGV